MPDNKAAPNDRGGAPLLVGDYRLTPDGPTIFMSLLSAEAAAWLKAQFDQQVPGGEPFDLTAHPRVTLTGIGGLVLAGEESRAMVRLRRTTAGPPPDFKLAATPVGWAQLSGLLDPFVHGESGHQYLTRSPIDDAELQISFGEPDFRYGGDVDRPDLTPGARVHVLKDPAWNGPWPDEPSGTIEDVLVGRLFITTESEWGRVRAYKVRFDDPQFDGDGQGPFVAAVIWQQYLRVTTAGGR